MVPQSYTYMRSVLDRNVVMRRIPVYEIVIHLQGVVTTTYLKQPVRLVSVFAIYGTCNDIPQIKLFVLLRVY